VADAGLARFQKGNPPDEISSAILEANVKDEVTHVGAAVKWFKHICERDATPNPELVFHENVRKYFRGALKPPFNDALRLQAGMTPEWYLPLVEASTAEDGEGPGPSKSRLPPKEDEVVVEEEEEGEMEAGAVDDFFDALNA